MKRVRIAKGNVGLVTKGGDYNKVLVSGLYFLGFGKKLTIFGTSIIYPSNLLTKLMLYDDKTKRLIEQIEVKDNEIALMYEDGKFKGVIVSGNYFYFKGFIELDFDIIDLNNVEKSLEIDNLILQKPAVKNYIRTFTVESYEIGLLFVNNKFVKKLEPGIYNYWKNPIPVEVKKVDLRQLQLEISGQELLTKDKAALRINFFAQYKIYDAEKSLLQVNDFQKQLYILIQLSLREYIGTLTLDELLEKKETVSDFVLKNIKTSTEELGISVLFAGIRDIILPGDVKEIMNRVLIAEKQAQASVITRREEIASTRNLLNTAKLMEENAMLFKLKEMEYLEKIADKVGEITLSGGTQVLEQLRNIFIK